MGESTDVARRGQYSNMRLCQEISLQASKIEEVFINYSNAIHYNYIMMIASIILFSPDFLVFEHTLSVTLSISKTQVSFGLVLA